MALASSVVVHGDGMANFVGGEQSERCSGVQLPAIYCAGGMVFTTITARGFLLPLYATDLGMDRAQVGLLFSAFALAAMLLSLPVGMLADRLGAALVFPCAIALLVISQVALGLTTRFELLLIWQFVGGAGCSGSVATLMAILANSVLSSRTGRAMGSFTLANQFGYLLGPALAGVGLYWLPLRVELVGSTIFCAGALALSPLMGLRRSGHRRVVRLNGELRRCLRMPAFYALAAALVAAAMLWGTVEAYLPLMGRTSMGLTNVQIGLVIAGQAFINGMSRVPSGWLVDRVRDRSPLIALCTIGYALTVAAIPQLSGVWAAALVMFSVAFVATAFVGLAASFAELARPEGRGIMMGIYVSTLNLGLAAGPAAFGTAVEAYGFGEGLALCSIAASLLAIIALGVSRIRIGQLKPASLSKSRRTIS